MRDLRDAIRDMPDGKRVVFGQEKKEKKYVLPSVKEYSIEIDELPPSLMHPLRFLIGEEV